ncbi:MAG: Na(+)-translocating NADH-quinone reductase subunit A [Maritimibacter sp.]|nr:Na(+)-translocating NADH-quinone reductase subunit A [Maritimibacter sp.]
MRLRAGLNPGFASPPLAPGLGEVVTEEAVVLPPPGAKLHITPLVQEGERVRAGAPVACLRHAPAVCLVAPMQGQVARIDLMPGRILNEIVLFRDSETEGGTEVEQHDVSAAGSLPALRRLLQGAGVWPWIGRRPFGGMPGVDEVPASILVMGSDTRPFAPDPQLVLEGRHEAFARGLDALTRLTDGTVFVTWPHGLPTPRIARGGDRISWLLTGPRHPQASPGICLHRAAPAALDAPVWDLHAEDVAHIGDFMKTGRLSMTRHVHIAGSALAEARMVRTTTGADLRQLVQGLVTPGPHKTMAGGPLDGRSARWLGPRDRQVTVTPRTDPRPEPHWLIRALTSSAFPRPVIPTAALTQAFASALPAVPFLRALGAGDEEAAMRLGLLSLLEEDIALADYVLGTGGDLQRQLRALLDRIETENAP